MKRKAIESGNLLVLKIKWKIRKIYDEFLVPTLKNAYKHLPRNKFICLNMPDIMYDKIKKRWKKVTKCEDYSIVKRTGGPTGKENRRGKELIFCWKKR